MSCKGTCALLLPPPFVSFQSQVLWLLLLCLFCFASPPPPTFFFSFFFSLVVGVSATCVHTRVCACVLLHFFSLRERRSGFFFSKLDQDSQPSSPSSLPSSPPLISY